MSDFAQPTYSIQHLANYIARQLAGFGAVLEEGDTWERLTQGLNPFEVEQAREYAQRAAALWEQMRDAPPGTRLEELPGWDSAQGLTPVANVLHVYGTRKRPGGPLTPSGDYRSDLYGLSGGMTASYLQGRAEERDMAEWTPPASELDADYPIEYIIPFDLYG
jgi:hypothetical protein